MTHTKDGQTYSAPTPPEDWADVKADSCASCGVGFTCDDGIWQQHSPVERVLCRTCGEREQRASKGRWHGTYLPPVSGWKSVAITAALTTPAAPKQET